MTKITYLTLTECLNFNQAERLVFKSSRHFILSKFNKFKQLSLQDDLYSKFEVLCSKMV